MRLATKVAYNTIVQIASKVVSTVLGLIAVAVMARYLGQVGFGQYTTIMTFLSFFAIIADLGLTLVTVQLIARPGADEKKILGNLLGLRLLTAIFFLALASLAVLFFPYPGIIKLGVALTAVSFLGTALNQIFVGLFQKYLRLDKISIAEVANRVVLLGAIIVAARLDYGLVGVLWATVFSSVAGLVLHYLFSRPFVRVRLEWDFAYWGVILRHSWPLAITIFFNMIYLRSDILLLSLIPRNTDIGLIAEVGLYGAAYKVLDVVIAFPFMFAGIILPIMTARWAENNFEGFKKVLQKSFDIMVILALPLMVGTQFVAEPAMALVAGDEFLPSAPILRILILAAGFVFLGSMFAHAVIAIDRQRKIIGAYAFTAVTALAGYFIFIPRFSYFGAAWVTIYSEAFIAFASLYIVWKYTGFRPRLSIILKSAAAAGLMALALHLSVSYLAAGLFARIILAAIVYAAGLYAFRGLRREDFLSLLNKG